MGNEITLNNLFCTLVLYDYNMRMLHWKCSGLDFGTKHDLMDEYHSTLNSFTDEIGEILMMMGQTNLPTLPDIISYATANDSFIVIKGDKYYNSEEVITCAGTMLSQLCNLYKEVERDESLPSDVVSTLDEHQYWLRKEAAYKLRSTLIK